MLIIVVVPLTVKFPGIVTVLLEPPIKTSASPPILTVGVETFASLNSLAVVVISPVPIATPSFTFSVPVM